MLTNFSVTNFKNFQETLHFDLTNDADITKPLLIYGKNGSGKSNLAQALFDIKSLMDDEFYRPMAICANADSSNEIMQFAYTFQLDSGRLTYAYERDEDWSLYDEILLLNDKCLFKYNHVTKSFASRGLGQFGISDSVYAIFSSSKLQSVSFLKYLLTNTLVREHSIFNEFLSFIKGMSLLLDTSSSKYQGKLTRILASDPKLFANFQGLIRQVGFTEELKLSSSAEEPVLEIVHKRALPFFPYASTGLQAFAKLFFTIYCQRNSTHFIFLDEFDSAYHYSLAKTVLKVLSTFPSQVIVTTHNIALLREMNYNYVAVLSSRGIAPLKHLTNIKLAEGLNLEQLYRSGEFDGCA